MTEGTITGWKLRGDTFSAGDVLLEMETDTAQMDVEALGGGNLVMVIVQVSTGAVQVGSRVAVLAVPCDYLASLEVPQEKVTKGCSGSLTRKRLRRAKGRVLGLLGGGRANAMESSVGSAPDALAIRKAYSPSQSVAHPNREHTIPAVDFSAINATGPKGGVLASWV